MASSTTRLTELGTAVGLVVPDGCPPESTLDEVTVPGLADDVWRPVVGDALAAGSRTRALAQMAMSNGQAFRRVVLGGRRPQSVVWSGAQRATWTSDVPRDLTVDRVWFIQAKYDSRCVLNTAPATLVDELLAEDDTTTRPSWYEQVALDELAAYYRCARDQVLHGGAHQPGLDPEGLGTLPDDVRDLTGAQQRALRRLLADVDTGPLQTAYLELCNVVADETARRWQRRLRSANPVRRTQMFFRMLRIAGAPYWLLGTKGRTPVRLAVTDTSDWRQRFELVRFDVRPTRAGQPRVDWRAVVRDRGDDDTVAVEGYCEIRWSHGKLSGNPECKVQVGTPLHLLPGYDPMEPAVG
ncbi:MAG: hypothetical protein JJU45_09865 [Acidimicrobiia bacterium]|nr:hypothetical protein [Acidimicrobiia bacterium]